ncbi:unnamed protein product [Nesidiocoris tenuis]|uniref:DDE-1 domain-containing protein n=1 Tax=Nesidiocoris tenuis TaxID=355587 RepID=A0A6H5GZP8_9HEMI|nr:unnamed protein product [Nesidiocoris tenuis]
MDEKTSTEDKSSQCASEKPAIPTHVKRKKAKLTISRVLDKRRKRVPAKARADDVAAKRAYRECDLDRALFRWYSRRTDGQGRPANVTIADLANRALVLAKRLGAGDSNLKRIDDDWVANWSDKFGVRDFAETEERPVKSEDLETILDEYNDDQIYTGLAFEFDWTSLPDRNATRKLPDERIWLLMAGNKSGRHRTRILITGKEWRPDSLKHVNMLSQPVVYAGGGVGRITPDLFSWWFHREFAPAALLLNESGAVLVMESADYLPSPHDCVTANGKVKLVLYNPSSSAPSQHRFDQNLLKSELKTRYAMLLLTNLTLEPRWLTVPHVLSNFSLKEAFPLLHKAWLNVRPETFSRCWTTSAVASTEEDRIMLLELQWISHDVGLDVTDEDVKLWAYSNCGETSADPESVKPEPREDRDGSEAIPTASEAVAHLNKALLWMESEPIEPTYLLAGKMGLASGHPGSGLPFFCHNGDPLSQPPPAHMGIPPYQLDPKGVLSACPLRRRRIKRTGKRPKMSEIRDLAPPRYGQRQLKAKKHNTMLNVSKLETLMSCSHLKYLMCPLYGHTPSMYPISSGSAGFRSPYPSSLPIGGPNLSSQTQRLNLKIDYEFEVLLHCEFDFDFDNEFEFRFIVSLTSSSIMSLTSSSIMYDNSMNEPLNLCKKKKPVAIVAPSSVVEEDELKEAKEAKRDDGGRDADADDGAARADDVSAGGNSKADAYQRSVYSMIRSLAASEQNLLTAMYMGGLMSSAGLIPAAGRPAPPAPPFLNPYVGLWAAAATSDRPQLSPSSDRAPASSPPPAPAKKNLPLNVPKIDLSIPQHTQLSLNIPNLKAISQSSKTAEKPAKTTAKW